MWFFFVNKYRKKRMTIKTRVRKELPTLGLTCHAQAELLESSAVSKGLTNFFIKSKPLVFKNSLFYIFTRYFLRGGSSLKALGSFHAAFTRFYNTIFEDVEVKKKKFINFTFIFNTLSLSANFFNINTFFFFLTKYIIYSFYFKIKILPKFLKKRLKTKYVVEPVFLEKNTRHKKTLRLLSLNIDLHKSMLLKNRFFNSIKDLAFNAKKSSFYLEKIALYLKIFKLFKKRKKI